MFHLLLVDFFFGPLEWHGVLIPAGDKGFNGIDQHFDAGKAGALKCAAAQNAKPAFHLIEPGAVGWDEMKMDLRMGFEPAILLGFMRIEIVQHYVNLFSPSPPWQGYSCTVVTTLRLG